MKKLEVSKMKEKKIRFAILFLTIFYISMSQAVNHEIGKDVIERSVFPHYALSSSLGGDIQKAASAWVNNEHGAEYIYMLITKKPDEFDKIFPSSSVDEINDSLEPLKAWSKYLQKELAKQNLWGFDFFPKNETLEASKRTHRRQIIALEEKINELREKRKTLYPPKLPLISRCALFFRTKLNLQQ